MNENASMEFSTGLFVLLGFAALIFLATQTTNLEAMVSDDAYRVTARFEDVSGLKERSAVTMAGVKIGRVERIQFDRDDLDAVVTMRIESRYDAIPDDADAAILTAGLLGSKYVGIGPGGSDTFLEEGSEIEFTQSSMSLERLVSKYLFSQGEGE